MTKDNSSYFPKKPLYPPGGHVDVSQGTAMPEGILSMKPLVKGGVPMAARAVKGGDAVRGLTSPLQKQLAKFPNQAPRIRAAQASKKR